MSVSSASSLTISLRGRPGTDRPGLSFHPIVNVESSYVDYDAGVLVPVFETHGILVARLIEDLQSVGKITTAVGVSHLGSLSYLCVVHY